MKIWRYAHLYLAITASVFIILASVSGGILSLEELLFNPIHKTSSVQEQSLSVFLEKVKENYPLVTSVQRNDEGILVVHSTDEKQKNHPFAINSEAQKIKITPSKSRLFFQKVTSFHRSLFMGNIGRFFIGISAIILSLICLSGIVLAAFKAIGFKYFFRFNKEEKIDASTHTALGKILFIPLWLIAVSASYLYLEKFIEKNIDNKEVTIQSENNTHSSSIGNFIGLNGILVSEMLKVEFPFSEFEEDYFIVTLKDKTLYINQFNGSVIDEKATSPRLKLTVLAKQIHTGKGLVTLSILWFLSSLGALFFIFSGFSIVFKRKGESIKNPFSKNEAQYVVLFGSENGSTRHFAQMFFQELVRLNLKAYLTSMNNFSSFKNVKHLIIFTSTYANGQAPSNAKHFQNKFEQLSPKHSFEFSVFGFGSKSYPQFCAFAYKTHIFLKKHLPYSKSNNLFLINQQSPKEYINSFEQWFERENISGFKTPEFLNDLSKSEISLEITYHSKTLFSTLNTFVLHLKPNPNFNFTSGDLLGITPNDNKERLYSVGKNTQGEIVLCVKKHPLGKVSQQLYQKNIGDTIDVRPIKNPSFYLPKNTHKVLFIATGTGICPFIGMINQNLQTEFWLIWGGKTQKDFQLYEQEISTPNKNKFECDIALSQENHKKQYVQNLIKNNAEKISQILDNKGIIFICGSIQMCESTLKILNEISIKYLSKPIEYFIEKKQIRTDCY